ncbi:hypothetical protein J6590_034396 [Homalodisca vitripennis]|nr:hypothetical protein J6590_034396 [Homalodisca vitripennis]
MAGESFNLRYPHLPRIDEHLMRTEREEMLNWLTGFCPHVPPTRAHTQLLTPWSALSAGIMNRPTDKF